jgi:hypothetical protein
MLATGVNVKFAIQVTQAYEGQKAESRGARQLVNGLMNVGKILLV